jgi:hypothetical protein
LAPAQQVCDRQTDRDRDREGGDSAATTHSSVEHLDRRLASDQQRAADAGHREPPSGLPQRAPEHRLARPRRDGTAQGQTDRHNGDVSEEGQRSLLRQRLTFPPARPLARDFGGERLDAVLHS